MIHQLALICLRHVNDLEAVLAAPLHFDIFDTTVSVLFVLDIWLLIVVNVASTLHWMV